MRQSHDGKDQATIHILFFFEIFLYKMATFFSDDFEGTKDTTLSQTKTIKKNKN